ncbi:DUF4245 domain-containing protein [Halostreptopolyspora alba]|uniref:DUF4245 domain-containing protein n=1 Tax=Halostreptopolyspora alba TaxID=2487137 RepID=A0A3N0E412_9ACTN|nr:DUF4245 domain-containing protein [Nocardiopsaceae bacterium YIM 96095]
MSNYSRADATFGSYAAALGLLVAILLVMAFVVSSRSEERIPRVDYGPDVRALTRSADYTVLVPEGLPEGWVPTSSELDVAGGDAGDTESAEEVAGDGGSEPATWTLGFATPEDHHARVSMSGTGPERFVAQTTGNGEPDGVSEVGGDTWERYRNEAEEERSLATTDEGGATVVVTGTGGYEELETLAASLEPHR